MRKFIHKLRQKPEEERRHILHTVTIIAAVVMIILWTYSLGRSISSPETKVKIKQDLKPFSVLKDNIVGGYKNISNPASDVVE
ncbi:MAG: hypothetical protein WC264_01375 [Candidatus Paceibacterota bacterium]|jgi:hypothetical protein